MTVSLAAPAAHADTTKITPKITLVAANDLTYDNPTTTVTGTVTGVWPDGTTRPLADQAVRITCVDACVGEGYLPRPNWPHFTEGHVTTNEAGQFTVPVTTGSWEVNVTAWVDASDTVAASSASRWLVAQSNARIRPSVSPAAIKASSPTTTFSGVLDYLGADHTWKPLPGRTVRIEGTDVHLEATTGADGSFSVTARIPHITLTPGLPDEVVRVSWTPEGTDTNFFRWAPEQDLGIYPAGAPVFSEMRGVVSASGAVSISGAVTGIEGITVPVTIEYSADGKTGWSHPTTFMTAGHFTSTFAAPAVPAYYRAKVVEAEGYDGAISSVVKVGRSLTSINGFTASVDANHIVSVHGTVGPSGMTAPVKLEYSSNGKTGWKTAKTVTAHDAFSTTFKTPLATGYYRAGIAATTYNTGSTSHVVKAGRTQTRIVGVKVSSTRVKRNSYFTITGFLQKYSAGWKGLKGQRVWIVFHLKGSTALHVYAKPLTGTAGKFTAKIKATRDAYWVPAYAGATGYYAAPAAKYIHVTLR
jgi:hypothetical protein